MKLIKAASSVGLVTLVVFSSSGALAQDTGWYGGASVGRASANIDEGKINSGLMGNWFSSSTTVKDEHSTGYKIFGGYQLNKNVALEGGYFDLGRFGYTATTVPAGTLDGTIKVKGLNLDLVGTLPVTDKFSVLGRAGLNYAQTRDAFRGTGAVLVGNSNPSKNEINYKLGLGLQYALTDSLAVRAEVERYRINDALGNKGNIDLASVGLVYSFGPKASPKPAPAPEPMPAAKPEPVPEPVVVPKPEPVPEPVVVPKSCTLSAAQLFDFDSDQLKMPQLQLDKMADILVKKPEIKDVSITGYSDRLGSDQYNQKLSERRAQAVKAYLSSKGVEASRIKAQGKGKADPVVTCTEKKLKLPALIQCLEPNRRVVVEKLEFACPAK